MPNSLNQNFKTGTLLRFALPSMIMMVFMSLYTIVDGIFVSRILGSEALSATNIVYPVFNVVLALGIMLATGGSAVIAKKMGEGKNQEAKEDFTLFTVTGIIIAVVLMVLTLCFLKPLVYMLGADAGLYENCSTYLRVMIYFAPCCMLQCLFQSFFATAGKPMYGLILTVTGGVLNAVLDYVSMAVLGMGIGGAALATGIGQAVPAVFGLLYFTFRKNGLRFTKLKWHGKALINSCLNGSSEMVTNLSNAVITYLFNIILMRMIGADGVAAITIILYGQFVFNSLYMGFSIGVAPIVSFQYGAKNRERLKKVYWISMRFVVISSVCLTILAVTMSDFVTAVFVERASSTYALTVTGFAIFSLNYAFSGFNIFTSAMFTALSDGKTSAMISFLRTFVCIVASLLILPQILGLTGVWLAVPVAEFLTIFLAVYATFWRTRASK